MDYSDFLFCNLLREFNSSFNELPYDEMYLKYRHIKIDFDKSKYNVLEKTEYQCICDFLENIEISKLKF